MSNRFDHAVADGVDRDMEIARALSALDPGSHDPTYWSRFGDWVIAEAGAELARRRTVARMTIGDVLFSWSRAVVPTALAAAALAGLLLLRGQSVPTPDHVGVEELLVSDLDGLTIPFLLSPESPVNSVSFVSEIF